MPRIVKLQPTVFVTRPIADAALAKLATAASVDLWNNEMPPPRAALLKHLSGADGILSMITDRLDAAAIARAPKLRVISNLGVGVDNIDLKAATRAGIVVGHTPGILTQTTADLAFALLMAAARRVAEGDRYVRAGRWRTWGPKTMLGRDVHGATLGIIGFGAIGQAVAHRGLGFGMRILYSSRRSGRSKTNGIADSGKFRSASLPRAGRPLQVSMDRLLKESDFVSLHVPLTAATRHLLGAREFARMKAGAILINTARGAVIDQRALADALGSGHLGGAGLDVTDPEPIERRDAILEFGNVVITPHIGSASIATRERMAAIAVDNILAVFAGRMPRYCANADVKPARSVIEATYKQ